MPCLAIACRVFNGEFIHKWPRRLGQLIHNMEGIYPQLGVELIHNISGLYGGTRKKFYIITEWERSDTTVFLPQGS